jgi:hypothetical protein
MRNGLIFEIFRDMMGGNAKVALFPFGDLKMRMARLGFARDLMGVWGLNLIEPATSEDFGASLSELMAHSPDYLVMCAGNEDYDPSRWPWMANIRSQFPYTKVIVAGKPDNWEDLEEDGVAHFISAGMDIVEFGEALMEELEGGLE